jgi:hypothetical protein
MGTLRMKGDRTMNTQPQGTPLNMEAAELLLRQIVFDMPRYFSEALCPDDEVTRGAVFIENRLCRMLETRLVESRQFMEDIVRKARESVGRSPGADAVIQGMMQTIDYAGPQSYTPLNVEGVEALLYEIVSRMTFNAANALCPDPTTGEAGRMDGRLCQALATRLAREAKILLGP